MLKFVYNEFGNNTRLCFSEKKFFFLHLVILININFVDTYLFKCSSLPEKRETTHTVVNSLHYVFTT